MKADHIDVLIIGAGLSGIGAAYHLQQKCPGRALRHPRGPRPHRRDLGPVPLSGRALGLRHVHARLLVPALDRRQGHRRRSRPSSTTCARRRASTASTARSASTIASSGVLVVQEARWTVEVERGAAEGAASTHLQLPVRVQRLLQLCRGLCPGFAGHRQVQGPDRPSAALDRRPRLRGQARRRDRQRRHRGHARAGARESARPTSPCCSARRPMCVSWPDEDGIANAAAPLAAGEAWRAPSCAGRMCSPACTSFASASAIRRAPSSMILDGVRARAGPDYDIARISRPATTRGINGFAWRPTAISSTRSGAAGPRS